MERSSGIKSGILIRRYVHGVNVLGTECVIRACKDARVKRLIFTSRDASFRIDQARAHLGYEPQTSAATSGERESGY